MFEFYHPNQLTPQTASKELPKGIIGLSRTESQKELAQYYPMADVFCNLTYQATFPTVNMEASAFGIPVITYNIGGLPKTINETNRIVIEREDLLELAKTLKEYRLNPYLTLDSCRKRIEINLNNTIIFKL